MSVLKTSRKLVLTTAFVLSLILVASVVPVQSTITFGSIWRDLNPTQYTTDVAGTLRGVYVRSGGTGAIGAGDGWAVGGDSGSPGGPIIAHYDGFSWAIYNSPVSTAVWNSVHFCTAPGAPGVGLCSPNGDGSDGWIVGTAAGAARALYWDGAALTDVSTGLATYAAANLTSVFLVCHSPPYGTGCPSSASTTGLAYAVGSAGGGGAIFAFNGDPKGAGGWTPQTVSGPSTTQYNSVYMYIDQSGNLAGFAVGNGGVVARLNSGTWTASVISPGASDLESVFVDQGNPADAWAVGRGGQIWHFTTGIWTGYLSPLGTSNNLFNVFLTSTSEGWIFGDQGTILHSTNLGSGNSWLALTTPLQTAVGMGMILFGGSFPAGGNGWAVGSQGVILHTDGSSCGNSVPSPCWGGSTSITQVTSSQELNAVSMVSSTDAWAGGMWDTTSSTPSLIHWDGDKWHRATVAGGYLVTTPDIWGIDMLGSSQGWAVGGNTANTAPAALIWDGNVWTIEPIAPCSCSLRFVSMVSSSDGWAVGTSGNIFRFQSGSWLLQSTPVSYNLNGVFISNPGSNTNAGWAVGDSGTVLKLDLTGVPTWSSITPSPLLGLSPRPNLYGVYFTDSNHGWIVGDHATILTTTDGGNTWSGGEYQLTFGANTIFRSIFIDTYGVGSGNGDGWAVGNDGATPGNAVFGHWDGAIWQNWPLNPLPQTYPTEGLVLYSVYLTSPLDGFAVGAGVSGTTTPLSGIFHLDPPTIPVQIATTTAGSTSSYTSTITSTIGPSTTTSSTSTSTTSSTQITSSTLSTTSQQSTSSSQTQTTSSESVATTTSSSTTPLVTPVIPGFPVESILAGILVGLTALAIARRRHPSKIS